MLKHALSAHADVADVAAAFGRLCVETSVFYRFCDLYRAAAFGRLCVETFENLEWRKKK